MSKPLSFIALFALAPLAQTNAATLVGALNLTGKDVDGLGSGESSGDFASPKTFNEVSDLSLNDVAWSDGGYNGVVDISLVATVSGAPTDLIGRGSKGAFGINVDGNEGTGGPATISAGDGTLTLSNLQFTYVSGDALSNIYSIEFAAVYINSWRTSDNDAGTLNGVAITTGSAGGNLTADGRNDLVTAASSVIIDATAGDGWAIGGVDILVTAVPEPSSAALLGLGGLALILRRRK
ncbi:PEP-CTERM sorting domain-containing protein [Verrucomicrobiaceae bacterium R5-34]|nr:PEP-CTERM sorting domain-containing protein [Verrucomicrobiaceae bacterium R5-34]